MDILKYAVYSLCMIYIAWWLTSAVRHKEKHELMTGLGAWLYITLCFESFGQLLKLNYWTLESALWMKILGILLIAAAGLIFLISARTMRRKGNPEKGWEQTRELVVDGIFGVIRHPIYFSYVLAFSGVMILKISLFSIIVAPIGCLFTFLAAWFEDDYDVRKFGEAYQDYRKNTKLFIPFLF